MDLALYDPELGYYARAAQRSGRAGAVVTDVDPDGASAGALRQGDVILSVNGKAVSNAVEAARELQKVQSGRLAQLRVWRAEAEVFVPVKKD